MSNKNTMEKSYACQIRKVEENIPQKYNGLPCYCACMSPIAALAM